MSQISDMNFLLEIRQTDKQDSEEDELRREIFSTLHRSKQPFKEDDRTLRK
jgi:hypothetical protein